MISYRGLTLLWLFVLTVFHLWFNASGHWPLEAEEAQYWVWSRHLDWSYYSKGPMVAYLIGISTHLGGHTEFWVRLPAFLLGTGVAGVGYLLAHRVFQSECAGFLTVLFLSLMPLYVAGSFLMTTDTPFVFCWALTSLLLCRATRRRTEGSWYGVGLAFGLGLLSKYTMLMVLPCILLWLVASPRLRLWLRRREPYEAVILGLLIFSPVIVWNARHGWMSGRHVLTQASGDDPWTAASLLGAPEFLVGQLGVVSPFLFLLMLLAVVWAWREGIRQGRDDFLLLVYLSAPVFLFFQGWSFVTKIQGNWAAHAYFTAAVAAAGWSGTWSQRAERRRETKHLRTLLLASIIALALLVPAFFILDLWAPFGLRLPANLDLIGKRMRGWPELGQAVGEVMQSTPRPTFLMSDRYQTASELAFYVPGNPRVFNVNLGRRMNQYDVWGGWDELRGRDGLFITDWTGDPPGDLETAFHQVERVRVVPITHNGQHLRDFAIYWGRDFRGFPTRAFNGF